MIEKTLTHLTAKAAEPEASWRLPPVERLAYPVYTRFGCGAGSFTHKPQEKQLLYTTKSEGESWALDHSAKAR